MGSEMCIRDSTHTHTHTHTHTNTALEKNKEGGGGTRIFSFLSESFQKRILFRNPSLIHQFLFRRSADAQKGRERLRRQEGGEGKQQKTVQFEHSIGGSKLMPTSSVSLSSLADASRAAYSETEIRRELCILVL